MTGFFDWLRSKCARSLVLIHAIACVDSLSVSLEPFLNRSLTVPWAIGVGVLGCWFQVEGLHQLQRRRSHVLLVQRRPEIDHVPLRRTACLEALEHVLLQVYAERSPPAVAAMDRTGATTGRDDRAGKPGAAVS